MLNICKLDPKTLYSTFNRHLFNPTGSEVWAKYLSSLSPWYPLYPSCDVCAGCLFQSQWCRSTSSPPLPQEAWWPFTQLHGCITCSVHLT